MSSRIGRRLLRSRHYLNFLDQLHVFLTTELNDLIEIYDTSYYIFECDLFLEFASFSNVQTLY